MVAASEFGHLAADLSLVLGDVLGLLVQDAGRSDFVEVVADAFVERGERLNLPRLPGQPREHAAFDVGQVGDDQLLARRGHDAPTDGRGDQVHDVVEQQVLGVGLHSRDALLHGPALDDGTGKVLRLKHAAAEAACAGRAAEL